jgi:hypothetical protein
MFGLRLLLRATPFLLGAAAAALWLRRETVERPQLPPPQEPDSIAIEGAAVELDSEPVDIVTVVDDLLLAGR